MYKLQVLDVRDPPPRGTCANTMAYIADVTGNGILVYDALRNRSWRVQNKLTFPHPEWGTITIAGESFDLMDGIMGLALSPRKDTRGKTFEALNNFYLPQYPSECTSCPVYVFFLSYIHLPILSLKRRFFHMNNNLNNIFRLQQSIRSNTLFPCISKCI